MPEKTMKEQRDEIARALFQEALVARIVASSNREVPSDEGLACIASCCFKAAEAFMAARYDADNGKRP